ncbi:MAG TPA: aspartate carbamoyltransferase [Bacteroides sp.]|nr:aspartate carbamoyltransferase [Bacteroides sp.]
MKNKNLVSITDFSREEYMRILELAAEFEKMPRQNILKDYVISTLFFEPSTRTRLSFETAINALGGKVIGFVDSGATSTTKGETLYDTIKMVSNYADLIVIRHPLEGSAKLASEISAVPIINAGDGANQHPTQTLLDMYSIQKTQGTLENLKIFMVGDLKYGRTVHSLLMAMSRFNSTFYFIAPDELKLPSAYKIHLDKMGLEYHEGKDLSEFLPEADIIYMTRVQQERFTDPIEYERVKNAYILRKSMLEGTRETMKVLHPLPRVNETHTDVDDSPHAYYFDQARNGVFVRMAIISAILGVK